MVDCLRISLSHFTNDANWVWKLKAPNDERNGYKTLATFRVQLDKGQWQYRAWQNLPKFFQEHTSSKTSLDQQRALIRDLGDWIGENILGDLLPLILDHAQEHGRLTLSVGSEGPRAGGYIRKFINCPLELARVDGRSLMDRHVSFVYQDNEALVKKQVPSPSTVNLLAVFCLPDATSALNLRKERKQLGDLVRSLKRDGKNVNLRILQYGSDIKSIRKEVASHRWDIVHFSAHGINSGVLIEGADGKPLYLSAKALVSILKPASKSLQLVTLSSCLSGAGLDSDLADAFGLQPPRGVEEERESRSPLRPDMQISVLGNEVSKQLGCAVLAMRYSVADVFAIEFSTNFYRELIAHGKTLERSVQEAIQTSFNTLHDCPTISSAVPVVFGNKGIGLTIQAARGNPGGLAGAFQNEYVSPEFVGRVPQLAKGCDAMKPNSPLRGVLFSGIVGGGKTTCAAELANHQYEMGRFDQVVWYQIPERTAPKVSAKQFCDRLSGSLPHPEINPDEKNITGEHEALVERLSESNVLIVIDQLERALVDDAKLELDPNWLQIIDFLQRQDGESRAILTSTYPAILNGLKENCERQCGNRLEDKISNIDVPPLRVDEVLLLCDSNPRLNGLLKTSGDAESERMFKLGKEIIDQVGGLPRLMEIAENHGDGISGQLHFTKVIKEIVSENADVTKVLESCGDKSLFNFVNSISRWAESSYEKLDTRAQHVLLFLSIIQSSDRMSHILEPTYLDVVSNVFEGYEHHVPDDSEEQFNDKLNEVIEVHQNGGAALSDLRFGNHPTNSLKKEQLSEVKKFQDYGQNHMAEMKVRWKSFDDKIGNQIEQLESAGLIALRPSEDTRSKYYFEIHPLVASLIKSKAPDNLQYRTNLRIGRYWYNGYLLGRGIENVHGGELLNECAKSAIPYLIKANEFEVAQQMCHEMLFRRGDEQALREIYEVTNQIAGNLLSEGDELSLQGMQAQILAQLGDDARALHVLKNLESRALEIEEFYVANTSLAYQVNILMSRQELAEAESALIRKMELTCQNNFGPNIALIDEGLMLIIKYRHKDDEQLLQKSKDLIARIERECEMKGGVLQTYESTISLAYEAAGAMENWAEALNWSRRLVQSKRIRQAPPGAIAKARFLEYQPLLQLGNDVAAKQVLVECKQVFEAFEDWDYLGKALIAMAHLEIENKNLQLAMSLTLDAARLRYGEESPKQSVQCHKLMALVCDFEKALSHYLAAGLIESLRSSSQLMTTFRLINRSLHKADKKFEDEPILSLDGAGFFKVIENVQQNPELKFSDLLYDLTNGNLDVAQREFAKMLQNASSILPATLVENSMVENMTKALQDDFGEEGNHFFGEDEAPENLFVRKHSKKLNRLVRKKEKQTPKKNPSDVPDDPDERPNWEFMVASTFVALSQTDPDEAEKCLRILLASARENDDSAIFARHALTSRADAHRIAGRYKEAIVDYTRLLEICHSSTDTLEYALLNRGFCHGMLNCSDEAIGDYSKVIEMLDPNSTRAARARFNRGARYLQQGKIEKAIEESLFILEMKNVKADDRGDVLLQLAEIYRSSKNYQRMLECLDECANDHRVPRSHQTQARLARAWHSLREETPEDTLADLETVIEDTEAGPEQIFEAWLLKCRFAIESGDEASGRRYLKEIEQSSLGLRTTMVRTIDFCDKLIVEQCFRTIVFLAEAFCRLPIADPEQHCQMQLRLLIASRYTGDFDSSLAAANRIIEMEGLIRHELVADSYFHRALVYAALGNLDDSIADYGRMLEYPEIPNQWRAEALVNRSIELIAKKNYGAALEDLNTVINMENRAAVQFEKALINRASIYIRQRKFAEAESDCQCVIDDSFATPQDKSLALCNLGGSFAIQERCKEALIQFSKVSVMDEPDPQAIGLALHGIGDMLIKIDDKEFADEFVNSIAFSKEHNQVIRSVTQATLIQRLAMDGDVGAAFNTLTRIIEFESDDLDAQGNAMLAVAGFAQNDEHYLFILGICDQLLSKPLSTSMRFNLHMQRAVTYTSMGNHTDALKDCEIGLEHPDCVGEFRTQALLCYTRILGELGRYQDVIVAAELAIRDANEPSTRFMLYLNTAKAHRFLESWKSSIAAARNAIELCEKDSFFYGLGLSELAISLARSNQLVGKDSHVLGEAIDVINQLIEQNGQSSDLQETIETLIALQTDGMTQKQKQTT